MRISDWSSDVCSSDLIALDRATLGNWAGRAGFHLRPIAERMCWHLADAERLFMDETTAPEIGRASCRERVCQYLSISVVAVSLKTKNSTATNYVDLIVA